MRGEYLEEQDVIIKHLKEQDVIIKHIFFQDNLFVMG